MNISFGIGVITFLLAIALTCASFFVPSRMGRFKPVPLLLVLFACYNVLPFLAVAALADLAAPMLGNSFDYYNSSNLARVGALVLGCNLAGLVGYIAASLAQDRRRRRRPVARSIGARRRARVSATSAFSFVVLALIALGLTWQLREFLFSGYHESFGDDQGEVLLRGSLSSIFSLLFVTYMFLWFAHDGPGAARLRRSRSFVLATFVLAVIGAALLSLGGRLYIASAILSFIAVQASRADVSRRGIRWRILLGAGGLLILAAGIGLWRTQAELNSLAVFVNLLGEPLFVSISLASLLASGSMPALSFPSFLLGDAVGLLPSVIYPQKLDRLFAIGAAYPVESPLGGLNGLASLVANFGWLGAIIVFGFLCFVIAWGSGAVCGRHVSPRTRLVYVIAVTMPLLSLLRDPFVISVYKNLLQNALVWPLLLALASGPLRIARRRRQISAAARREKSAADQPSIASPQT